MYNPSICLDIITKANPASVFRIKSYATLYTCYLWARYQSNRALNRWTAQFYYLDRATKTNDMASALADAISDMERPQAGERSKEWRKRRKAYYRMTEIIRRHWDESTGLFTWGNVTYGV